RGLWKSVAKNLDVAKADNVAVVSPHGSSNESAVREHHILDSRDQSIREAAQCCRRNQTGLPIGRNQSECICWNSHGVAGCAQAWIESEIAVAVRTGKVGSSIENVIALELYAGARDDCNVVICQYLSCDRARN